MITIKIGPRELGLVILFLLGLAVAAGKILQRVDTLERSAKFEHGGIFTGGQ